MQKLGDYSISMIPIENRKGKVNKILSTVITALVIGLLIFLGPVNALQLSLSGLKTTAYTAGETISFLGDIEIQTNEIVKIENVSVVVNGQTVCTITKGGWPITSCDGITMALVGYSSTFGYGYGYNTFESNGSGSYTGYGYGYGYHQGSGPGHITYNVTIETPQSYLWFGGNNKVKLITNTDSQILESDEYNIMLNPLIQGDGNFSMSTQDLDITLQGMYNSTDYTLAGDLYSVGTPGVHYIGIGNYLPSSIDSGDITIRLYDATRNDDVGIFWVGNYSNGTWTMHYVANPQTELTGIMNLAPQ